MLNKVVLQGRLTKDPEVRYTSENNIPIARFTLAVDRRKKGETDFINCTAWNKTAEFINNYFTKGKMAVIVGRIQTGSYEKDGHKVYTTDVVVEEVSFAGEKREKVQEEWTESNEPNPFDESDSLPY